MLKGTGEFTAMLPKYWEEVGAKMLLSCLPEVVLGS
jgi:hypothetical protein